jgi:hypothetical protein
MRFSHPVKLAQLFPGEPSMQRLSKIPHTHAWIPAAQTQLPLNVADAQRQFWKLDPVIHFYQRVEIVCHALLVFSGIGAVLYSVSVFLC